MIDSSVITPTISRPAAETKKDIIMSDAAAPAASAARASAGAIVRHALTVAGTALVAHGYVDQGTADGAISPIADYELGAALALGASGWGVLRARAAHWRWVQAWTAPARPIPPA